MSIRMHAGRENLKSLPSQSMQACMEPPQLNHVERDQSVID